MNNLKRFVLIVIVSFMCGCGTLWKGMSEPLTSPALTEQEEGVVKTHRLAHGAIREAAAAADIANLYIARKATPCAKVTSTKCSQLKGRLLSYRARVVGYEQEVERMRQLLAINQLSSAQIGAEQLRDSLLALQAEILK